MANEFTLYTDAELLDLASDYKAALIKCQHGKAHSVAGRSYTFQDVATVRKLLRDIANEFQYRRTGVGSGIISIPVEVEGW